MGGGISKMAKQELLATIRDRYRASPTSRAASGKLSFAEVLVSGAGAASGNSSSAPSGPLSSGAWRWPLPAVWAGWPSLAAWACCRAAMAGPRDGCLLLAGTALNAVPMKVCSTPTCRWPRR